MADADISDTWAKRRAECARQIQRRWVAHVAAGGTSDFAPAPFLNKASVYTDLARFEAEKKNLFRTLPLLAGLSGDLPGPGSSFLFEEAGVSILLTRDKSNVAHAFLNMCPHRGAKLVEKCKKQSLIVCPFHAWSFDATGKLIGLPSKTSFDGIDRSTLNLVPVPCAEWNGMIFVKAYPGTETIDVEAHLGDFAPELAQLEMARAEPVKNGVLTANANWKFALDTYGESYHFSTLHASTIGQTHFNDIAVYDRFGPHHRISFPDKSAADLVDKPEEAWPAMDYGGVHYLFPNTILFIGSIEPGRGYTQIFRLFPGDSVGTTRTLFNVYAPTGVKSDQHRAEVEFAYDATAQVVVTEDYHVASTGWANLANAPDDFHVVYGRNEIALQNMHRVIADAINMPLS
jgi:nitrite reductase/ring-hydroxylating ferredoxin subunit